MENYFVEIKNYLISFHFDLKLVNLVETVLSKCGQQLKFIKRSNESVFDKEFIYVA